MRAEFPHEAQCGERFGAEPRELDSRTHERLFSAAIYDIHGKQVWLSERRINYGAAFVEAASIAKAEVGKLQ